MILNDKQILNRIKDKYHTDAVFSTFKTERNADGAITRISEDNERVESARAMFENTGFSTRMFADAMSASATVENSGKKALLSASNDRAENKAGMKEMYALNQYYVDTFKNKGRTPDGRTLDARDFFQEIVKVDRVLTDNYHMGGALAVTSQSIVWAALEILPVEPEIYHHFTVPMQIEPGQILAFPYINLDSPGGLDYAGTQELLTVKIGEDYDALATTGQSGIAVHLTYDELAKASYDLVSIYFTAARNALTQWKSMKAINAVHQCAIPAFDNLAPEEAIFGETTGISLKNGGARNMTLTMKDVFDLHISGIELSHDYNTVLISPQGFKAVQNMPELKEYIDKHCLVWFPKAMGANGTIGRGNEPYWRKFKDGGAHNATFNRLTPNLPQGFTDIEMIWIVTKHIPTFREGDAIYKNYDLKSGEKEYYRDTDGEIVKCGKFPMTSMYFLDPNQALAYVQEKALSMIDKNDDFREYYRAHLKEKYSFHPIRKGKAIKAIKNIALVNEPTIDITKHITATLEEAKTILNGGAI